MKMGKKKKLLNIIEEPFILIEMVLNQIKEVFLPA
jgi:hypothetical protein